RCSTRHAQSTSVLVGRAGIERVADAAGRVPRGSGDVGVRRPGHAKVGRRLAAAQLRRARRGRVVPASGEVVRQRRRPAVFLHPYKRRPMNPQRYATNATQLWLASASRAAMPTRLGHANFSTTEGYIHAAKELYREEAVALEERMFGHTVGHNGASPP